MLLSSLLNIEKILKEKNEIIFEDKTKEFFYKFFKNKKVNDIINPYNIISEEFFSEKEAKIIFNEFVREGYFLTVFNVICPRCREYSMKIYYSIEEIVNEFICPKCEESFSDEIESKELIKNIRVLYVVIEE